jgi:hypothetical protein
MQVSMRLVFVFSRRDEMHLLKFGAGMSATAEEAARRYVG